MAGSNEEQNYAAQLAQIGRLTEPAIRRAIGSLNLSPGACGLDAGCGDGRHAIFLAEATAPDGRIVGLDLSAKHLKVAAANVGRAGFANRMDWKQGSILDLPFAADTFDYAWCCDTLWPGFIDANKGLQELTRVVKPHGTVAVAFWSAQLFFPGYPELEARFNLALTESLHYLKGLPEKQPLRALHWLQTAGLEKAAAHTFLADVCAPLTPEMRDSIGSAMNMLLHECRPRLAETDRNLLDRMCNPESADFLPDKPDYHCFVAYTAFTGKKPLPDNDQENESAGP